MKPVKVGIVGCGNISDIYFTNCQAFEGLEVAACADLILNRAKEKAAKHGVKKACSVKKLLEDKSIEIVVNLTIPKAHGEVALAALHAGKNVYNEKPLAVTREDGLKMLAIAKKKKLRIGVADMAYAWRNGRRHRANKALTYHVLDIMHAFHDASDSGTHVTLSSTCERPAPLPMNLPNNALDR